VRGLRTRSFVGQLDLWMLVIGSVLMPLGVVLIVLGYIGASHTPLPFEQNDYLISGGILGLSLVIAGGFVYFGYWQTIRVRESREQARELTAALGRVEALLRSNDAIGGSGAATVGTFVATASGSIFHRQECTVVAGRTDLRRVDPDRDGLAPCRICEPLSDNR
jgi:hypothetical protein